MKCPGQNTKTPLSLFQDEPRPLDLHGFGWDLCSETPGLLRRGLEGRMNVLVTVYF